MVFSYFSLGAVTLDADTEQDNFVEYCYFDDNGKFNIHHPKGDHGDVGVVNHDEMVPKCTFSFRKNFPNLEDTVVHKPMPLVPATKPRWVKFIILSIYFYTCIIWDWLFLLNVIS